MYSASVLLCEEGTLVCCLGSTETSGRAGKQPPPATVTVHQGVGGQEQWGLQAEVTLLGTSLPEPKASFRSFLLTHLPLLALQNSGRFLGWLGGLGSSWGTQDMLAVLPGSPFLSHEVCAVMLTPGNLPRGF